MRPSLPSRFWQVPILLSLATVTAGCASSVQRIQQAGAPTSPLSTPPSAVKYMEYQAGGHGGIRTLSTGGNAFYGIDSKSRITITVDEQALRDALPRSPLAPEREDRVRKVREQLRQLEQAVAGLEAVLESANQAARTYRQATTPQEFAEARSRIGTTSLQLQQVLLPLRRSVEARRSAEGALNLRAETNRVLDPVVGGIHGVNWTELHRVLSEEIRNASATLAEIDPGAGLQLEIRAHRITREPAALPVKNYNTVPVGQVRYPSRLQFEVSEEVLRLHEENIALAQKIQETKGTADALLLSLRTDFDRSRSQLATAVRGAREAVEKGRDALEPLARWTEAETMREWLDSREQRLRSDPAWNQIESSWKQVRTDADTLVRGIQEDFHFVRGLARLPADLQGVTPEEAMRRILEAARELRTFSGGFAETSALSKQAWMARADRIKAMREIIDASPQLRVALLEGDGPLADLEAVEDAARGIHQAVQSVHNEAVRWIGSVLLTRIPRDVSNLPIPAGQRRLDVASDLDAVIELAGDGVDLREGDRIRVEYRFFRDEELLPIGWSDDFAVREYGLKSEVLATLAFLQQDGTERWRPTPSLSWLMRYEQWPTSDDVGVVPGFLGRAGLGLGLSTMSLDFSDDHDIELGLALTGSLLGGRLLGGYGWNLQGPADRDSEETGNGGRGFWFFSIRLFSASGRLGVS